MRPLTFLAACAIALSASTTAQAGFEINRFFGQRTTGDGTVTTPLGVERFAVSTRPGGTQRRRRMLERFRYADGSRRVQDWTIWRVPTGYVATRPDLQGPTYFKRVSHDAYTYTWRQYLKPETRSDLVTLRGRVRQRPDGTVVNRALVFKGIVPVGLARVTFRPSGARGRAGV